MTLRQRVRVLRTDERGVTLIEVVVGLAIGMVVLVGVMNLLDSGARSATRTFDRADVTQRGRTAMNWATRQLRSQVCKDSVTPPVIAGDADSVTFYTDTDDSDGFAPQAMKLFLDTTWKGGRGAVIQRIWPGTDITAASTDRVLIQDVTRAKDDASGATLPFLRYYSWDAIAAQTTDTDPTPMAVPLSSDTKGTTTVVNGEPTTTLPANSIAKVLRTDIAFRVAPSSTTGANGALTGKQLDALRDSDFTAQVFVRNSDYTDQAAANNDRLWGPRCT